MSFAVVLLTLLLVLIAAFADQAWRFQHECSVRAREDWARDERLVVVAAERRLLQTGPFALMSAADQPVYALTVRTPRGERRAWLQCGELLWGVLSPTVVVHWDDGSS